MKEKHRMNVNKSRKEGQERYCIAVGQKQKK